MYNSKNRVRYLSLICIFGILFTLGIQLWFNKHPELAENLYYNRIYKHFRHSWDLLFSGISIPLFYIWLFSLLILFSYFLRYFFLKKERALSLQLSFILIALHFIWFYWTWGFNYARENLSTRWNLNAVIRDSVFLNEFYNQTKLIDSIRSINKNYIDNFNLDNAGLEYHIRESINQFEVNHGFLSSVHARCRNLSTKGVLLIWSTSGVYLPFTGQGQLDGGLHKLSKPFTMAHEMSHVMGWTHEGDCNFIAYLACSQHNDPFIKYSGELNYWRYLYAQASRSFPEIFKEVKKNLSEDILKDLREINDANNHYPEIFPQLRSWFYDWYLKSNGIANGDKSYSEIIRMVINHKNKPY
jgi:hypothetical protein